MKTQPLVAPVVEEPLAPPTVAGSLGRPYGRRYLAEKLQSSGAGELQVSQADILCILESSPISEVSPLPSLCGWAWWMPFQPHALLIRWCFACYLVAIELLVLCLRPLEKQLRSFTENLADKLMRCGFWEMYCICQRFFIFTRSRSSM